MAKRTKSSWVLMLSRCSASGTMVRLKASRDASRSVVGAIVEVMGDSRVTSKAGEWSELRSRVGYSTKIPHSPLFSHNYYKAPECLVSLTSLLNPIVSNRHSLTASASSPRRRYGPFVNLSRTIVKLLVLALDWTDLKCLIVCGIQSGFQRCSAGADWGRTLESSGGADSADNNAGGDRRIHALRINQRLRKPRLENV